MTSTEIHARRLSDYDADRLSIKAFHAGGKLCQKCQERYTVARQARCPNCMLDVIEDYEAAERRRAEAARVMPLFEGNEDDGNMRMQD